ncbi:beta strand repeat-containing protein [Anaerobiospirillum succiniciproducens]|uniref:beta strand repeat-containing protein n=1 Tax=Anaerobiospirillum succiniciproducens TaxID=13335 RepID=UPI000404B841|nr:autotransporter domain-containing protein [Anaerobiospirillum succiniciproducens]
MKQTNNAIKFLMAQYRAIFKNANIAMVAAMAAAALAAGQAQAATDFTAIQDGTVFKTGSLLEVSADANKENTGSFTATIQSGENTIDSTGTANHELVAKSGSFVIDGNGAKLTIGGSSGAKVTLASMQIKEGELVLVNDGTKNSDLKATGSIIIGEAANAAAPKAGKVAKVTIGKSGTLTTEGNKSVFTVNANGEIAFTKAATADTSKITAAKGVNLVGGTISVANSGAATVEGDIKASGGKILVGGDGSDATELTVNGNVAFKGEGGTVTIAEQGKLTVTHKTEDVSLNLGNATVTNGGELDFGTLAKGKSATLTVSADQYENLFKGKVSATGADDKAKFYLNVVGDTEIDLDTILNDGARDNAKIELTTAVMGGISATKAKYNQADTFKVGGIHKFGDLNAGKNNALKLSGSAVVEITNGLEVNGGANDGVLTVDTATLKLNGTGAEHTVAAKEIKLADAADKANAKLDVAGGTWSVGSLTVTKGIADIYGGSTLVVNGDLTTTDENTLIKVREASTLDATGASKLTLKSGGGNESTLDVQGGSTLEVNAAQVFTISGNTATLTDGTANNEVNTKAIKLSSDSVLKFSVADDFKINQEQLDSLIAALGTNATVEGFISFEDTNGNSIKLDGMSGGTVELDKVTSADVYDGATATTATGSVANNVMVGNINVTTNDGKVDVKAGKSVVLYKADANDNFVSNKTGTTDVTLADKSSLTLAGVGKAGAIDGAASGNGVVSFGHSRTGETAGEVTVTSIGAKKGVDTVNVVKGGVIVTAKPANSEASVKIQTKNLNLADGTFLKAADQDIVVASATADKSAQIFGDLTAKSLTLNTNGSNATTFNIAKGAFVDVDALTLQQSGSLFVGENDGTTTSSATLEVGKLTLAKGSLIVDPDMNAPASIAAVKDLSAKDSNGDAQVLDGKIAVGQNSAVGIGFDTRAEVEQVLTQAGLMADHKFINNQDSFKGALILNDAINVATGNGVLIDTSAKNAKDLAAAVSTDKFQMKGNAALIINDSVYKRVNGKLDGVAVTLANGAAGSVSAEPNSKVILNGDFDANDAGVKIFAGSGTGVAAVSDTINFETANGVLYGTIGTNGTIGVVNINPDKLDNKFLTVSAPVRDLLKTAILNEGGVIDKGQIGGKFLSKVANNITDSSGVAADAAAHAATYAGAQQAAVVSVTTMADAMFGRVGAVGVEAASIAATGSQANGGVWLTPMYKSMDADGFNAEGASYGSDVDAAGVAFGADTVNGNMRFGAVFNIGSGDAEGKGNGNGLKDEFDYYGFGIYSAMGFGNFALVGDASMTVVSHDVEGFGLRGKADTTAVTMGVTGQYTVATPMVDVTPHLGARFIRLNTDSYDLISADGVLATTDFDVQNVFSVPLGVTLSKAFVAGGWSLAPSADLTLTFNTGDTEAKSTTTFTGAPAIGLNTEVLDEVQYGLTVGLGAQYGAFGTSFGINYTGSENTDTFGVNAQARYMF